MIYEHATARQLGFARLVVFGVLLVDLLIDPVEQCASFTYAAFLPQGALRAVPDPWMVWLLSAPQLLLFKWTYAAILLTCLLGIGPRVPLMLAAVVGTTFFHGLARGFGGHINHQELIVLHCAILLTVFPCYDGFALHNLIYGSKKAARSTVQKTAAYRLGMRALCFWIMLTYFYVGLARVSTSDARVYFTNTMTGYALQHSLKWNYWDFSWAKHLIQQPYLQLFLKISFPLATLLELAAPLAVLYRKTTLPILASLVLFHVMILLFMNIFFWQNIVLFVVFLADFAPLSRQMMKEPSTGVALAAG